MDLELRDKAAVTGGSVGIGLGAAREGPQVLVARDCARVEAAAADFAGKFGIIARGHVCDVATADGCASLIPVGIRVNAVNPGLNRTPDRVRTATELAVTDKAEANLKSFAPFFVDGGMLRTI